MAGPLGCGPTTAYVQDRGGASGRIQVAYAQGSWARELDEMSSASVDVGAQGLLTPGCGAALARINAWEHELAIWRDGTEIWAGPVTEPIEATEETFTIAARDMFQWMERRRVESDLSYVAVDAQVVWDALISAALSRDNGMGLTATSAATNVTVTREYLAARGVIIADALRELARTAIDFTVVGRQILAGGQEVAATALPKLVTGMLSDVRYVERGLGYASEVAVYGEGGLMPNSAVVGVSGGVDADRGLVQRVFQEDLILDAASAGIAAATRLALYATPLRDLTGRLVEDAPLAVSQLIPGAIWPVEMRVGAKTISEEMRLRSVKGSFDAAGEQITVVLESLGTVA